MKTLKAAILGTLADSSTKKAHKHNLVGRAFQAGAIEHRLGVQFDATQRAMAASAFDELKDNGYVQSTFDDLVDPDNWISITDAGKQFLARGLRDHIDLALASINEHFVELRSGMHDAAIRTSPDAPRQAIHSARELIDQVLKEGAPGETTRKQRAKRIMERSQRPSAPSKSNIETIDACVRLIEAEHNKTIALAHARQSVKQSDAQMVVETTERIMRLIFQQA